MGHIPLFLLNTVLYPDARLPLKVFEARYLDMVSRCLKDEQPFGVCLIHRGQEVGEAAEPAPVGTLAHIERWDMPEAGVLHLLVRGGDRFEIESSAISGQLVTAEVRRWPPEPVRRVPPEYLELSGFLQRLLDEYGDTLIPPPHRMDDAGWVGMRLAQLLPVASADKQRWLQEREPLARLADIAQVLENLGEPDA